jgi:RNA polymerase sigma-70 factor (ECF subfamily)
MEAPAVTLGPVQSLRDTVEAVYRAESRRVLATLIRLLGDFELAEEALHEAFVAALDGWSGGLPSNPRAWLVSTGRFKAIDVLRRRARHEGALPSLALQLATEHEDPADAADPSLEDDPLRLIFTCCHPALPPDAQVALTLREVCGLTTEEIARAFLVGPPAVAQRIVRAKAKIREAGIPYEVPVAGEMRERLASVLRVVYLVFNEGYAASAGDELTRAELSDEAIRLGRLICALLPDPEAIGLLALMLLTESRRQARSTAEGEIVLLDEQDRGLWDPRLITEGLRLVERALGAGPAGPYALQAAIAAVHAEAADAAATDWTQIVALYDVLLRRAASPVVELNRAAALAMRDGPAAGVALIEAILVRGELADYAPAHAARAELRRKLGQVREAAVAYRRALELSRLEPERRFLARRLNTLSERPPTGP